MVSPIMLPVVALIVGCSLSVVLTPMARYFAIKFGLVDYPDRRRKLHRQPVARCGGPVLIGTLFLSVLAAIVIFPEQAIHLVEKSSQAASLALGAVAIAGLGMIDDRYGLLGRQKLAIQIAICLGMIAFGFDLKTIQIFRYTVDLGLLSWPISLIWLLLCINAINLIDGADGLCSTIGAIAFFAVAAISSYTGKIGRAHV